MGDVEVSVEPVVPECFECVGGTEKQAQASPATCSRCTALSKLSPVTSGTIDPLGKQPDQVTPMRERAGRAEPGVSAVAPIRASCPGPGTDRDDTTLWLAVVPLWQGVLKGTRTKPTERRTRRAWPGFMPMTFGTTTPGVVGRGTLVGDRDRREGGEVVVVVVVVGPEFASRSSGEGVVPQAASTHPPTRIPSPAATRMV